MPKTYETQYFWYLMIFAIAVRLLESFKNKRYKTSKANFCVVPKDCTCPLLFLRQMQYVVI